MLDARMLTLYKQHYLNDYPKAMKCQYSCLGYYDGMDIERIEGGTSEDESELVFYDLWEASINRGNQLSGGYSGQNISVFKFFEEDDETERFWVEQERMPFCSVCFIQMKDLSRYKELSEKIEKFNYAKNEDSIEYGVITYYTYDNADMIVLLNANSVSCLEKLISEIEREDEVVYLHSIWGISEEYLRYFKEQYMIPDSRIETWRGTCCCLDEKIDMVSCRLVTSYVEDLEDKIFGLLQKDLACVHNPDIQLCFATGHENMIVNIADVKVSDLLMLFVEGGFATHQNPLYGNGLYNVETSLRLKNKNLNSSIFKEKEEDGNTKSGWCEQEIKKLQEEQIRHAERKDAGLFACIHSIIQTLNMLSQYERFGISRNIFSVLYPSLELFLEQMIKALDLSPDKEELKSAISKYLDAVNSMVYHTVHTEQVFLMVPGYSGSAFVVPIKICMLYMWCTKSIIKMLNDSTNKYEALLTPAMEIRLQTSLVDTGLMSEDRLICIELSQRSLYQTNFIMIILAHEIAHYVGDKIRKRKDRLHCLIRSIASVLTEGIMPIQQIREKCGKPLLNENFTFVRERIFKLICKVLEEKIEKESEDDRYHATDILPVFSAACRQVLIDEFYGVQKEIYMINDKVHEQLRADAFPEDLMCQVYSFQKECDDNCREIIASGVFEKIIMQLITVYQEVFSDIAAYALLDFSADLFTKTFDVSEGIEIEERQKQPQQHLRENIIKKMIAEEEKYADLDYMVNGDRDDLSADWTISQKLYYELFLYDEVQSSLFEYAKACYHEINEHFKEDGLKQKMAELRRLFDLLNEEGLNQKIYDTVLDKMTEYKQEVLNEI